MDLGNNLKEPLLIPSLGGANNNINAALLDNQSPTRKGQKTTSPEHLYLPTSANKEKLSNLTACDKGVADSELVAIQPVSRVSLTDESGSTISYVDFNNQIFINFGSRKNQASGEIFVSDDDTVDTHLIYNVLDCPDQKASSIWTDAVGQLVLRGLPYLVVRGTDAHSGREKFYLANFSDRIDYCDDMEIVLGDRSYSVVNVEKKAAWLGGALPTGSVLEVEKNGRLYRGRVMTIEGSEDGSTLIIPVGTGEAIQDGEEYFLDDVKYSVRRIDALNQKVETCTDPEAEAGLVSIRKIFCDILSLPNTLGKAVLRAFSEADYSKMSKNLDDGAFVRMNLFDRREHGCFALPGKMLLMLDFPGAMFPHCALVNGRIYRLNSPESAKSTLSKSDLDPSIVAAYMAMIDRIQALAAGGLPFSKTDTLGQLVCWTKKIPQGAVVNLTLNGTIHEGRLSYFPFPAIVFPRNIAGLRNEQLLLVDGELFPVVIRDTFALAESGEAGGHLKTSALEQYESVLQSSSPQPDVVRSAVFCDESIVQLPASFQKLERLWAERRADLMDAVNGRGESAAGNVQFLDCETFEVDVNGRCVRPIVYRNRMVLNFAPDDSLKVDGDEIPESVFAPGQDRHVSNLFILDEILIPNKVVKIYGSFFLCGESESGEKYLFNVESEAGDEKPGTVTIRKSGGEVETYKLLNLDQSDLHSLERIPTNRTESGVLVPGTSINISYGGQQFRGLILSKSIVLVPDELASLEKSKSLEVAGHIYDIVTWATLTNENVGNVKKEDIIRYYSRSDKVDSNIIFPGYLVTKSSVEKAPLLINNPMEVLSSVVATQPRSQKQQNHEKRLAREVQVAQKTPFGDDEFIDQVTIHEWIPLLGEIGEVYYEFGNMWKERDPEATAGLVRVIESRNLVEEEIGIYFKLHSGRYEECKNLFATMLNPKAKLGDRKLAAAELCNNLLRLYADRAEEMSRRYPDQEDRTLKTRKVRKGDYLYEETYIEVTFVKHEGILNCVNLLKTFLTVLTRSEDRIREYLSPSLVYSLLEEGAAEERDDFLCAHRYMICSLFSSIEPYSQETLDGPPRLIQDCRTELLMPSRLVKTFEDYAANKNSGRCSSNCEIWTSITVGLTFLLAGTFGPIMWVPFDNESVGIPLTIVAGVSAVGGTLGTWLYRHHAANIKEKRAREYKESFENRSNLYRVGLLPDSGDLI